MKEDYSKNVELVCPVCGNKQFEHKENESTDIYICISCKRSFTKEEMIDKNTEIINGNIDDLKKEVMSDLTNEFKKIFGGK